MAIEEIKVPIIKPAAEVPTRGLGPPPTRGLVPPVIKPPQWDMPSPPQLPLNAPVDYPAPSPEETQPPKPRPMERIRIKLKKLEIVRFIEKLMKVNARNTEKESKRLQRQGLRKSIHFSAQG